ncbi:MAG: hypothetical protein B7733_18605 [Myxococcales bacterium FL481]|nr:MAG: hypothetical protein B7733_18605 [Myxococcales bacterium FL481]
MSDDRNSTRLGTGGPLLGAAKLAFLVAAYATTLVLARLFDDPATLGQYNVVARLVAVPNMVIVQTLLFAVSRPMAAQFDQGLPAYAALRRRGMQIAGMLGGATSLMFFAAAEPLAAQLRDPELIAPIRAVAPVSLFYAFYAVNIGTLNACRRFAWQAGLDVFMATAKATLIMSGAALGLSLAATVGGFSVAASLALALSVFALWRPRGTAQSLADSSDATPPMARFAGVLILFTASTNLLLSADLLVFKSLATEAQQDLVGVYSSAQLVALVPYSLLAAVSLLMFPLIATLSAAGDSARLRDYVRETLKVTLLLLALMSAVASASAAEIQTLLFPAAYADAAADLRRLVWGYSGYSLVVTVAWIFNSGARSRVAVFLVGLTLATVVAAASAWVEAHADVGAAAAVCVAGGVGVTASLVAVRVGLGVAMPWLHFGKLGLAIAAVEGLGYVWKADGYLETLGKLTVATAAFVAVLALTKAVTLRQLQELRHAG